MSVYEATVSPKGQVTVPVEVREALGLRSGDKVEFELSREGRVTFRAINLTIADLYGSVPYDGPPVSLEEIAQGIAEGAAGSATRPGSGKAAA